MDAAAVIPGRRRSMLAISAALLPAGGGLAHAAGPGPVVLGQVSLSFYAVTGAVVQEVLERLGHTVELRSGLHEDMFPLLGEGKIDLMAAVWLPEGHAAYWKRYGGDAVVVATLYEGARFFWAVPSYVPAGEVAALPDLARPGVAGRMAKTIQGIGAGAGITTLSQKAVAAYGLDAAGYGLRPGTSAEWLGACRDGLERRQWFVFPTWTPQYLNKDGRLRPLRDPQGILGGVNHGVLVAPRARLQALPERTRSVLARIDLGLDAVTEMDAAVNVGGATAREAARAWMARKPAAVAAWMSGKDALAPR